MLIKITKKTAGTRLDKFLTDVGSIWGKNLLSRNQIQKLIEQNTIKINNLPASSHYRLRPGDLINIQKKLIKNGRLASKKGLKTTPNHKIEIINETAEFIIINKPAGLAVEARSGYTLADWLKVKYPKIKNLGDDPNRPGIVHRLDKDVSGLMVIAKTQESFDQLKKQFAN